MPERRVLTKSFLNRHCHVSVCGSDSQLAYFNESLLHGKELFGEAFFKFYLAENFIGSFKIATMPFCCGACVMGNVWLNREQRGTIVSQVFRQVRSEIVGMLGYSVVLATTQTKDVVAHRNFEKVGYTEAVRFTNKRTLNEIALGYKEIE